MSEKPRQLVVTLKDTNVVPTYANFVDINRLGPGVFVDFGLFDAVKVVRQIEKEKTAKQEETAIIEVEVEPSVRIVIDFAAFNLLREKANILYEKIKDDPAFVSEVKDTGGK